MTPSASSAKHSDKCRSPKLIEEEKAIRKFLTDAATNRIIDGEIQTGRPLGEEMRAATIEQEVTEGMRGLGLHPASGKEPIGFTEELGRTRWKEQVPGPGTLETAARSAEQIYLANKANAGTATQAEIGRLRELQEEDQEASVRGRTVMGHVAAGATGLVPFVGEMAVGGGLLTAGRGMARRAGTEAAEELTVRGAAKGAAEAVKFGGQMAGTYMSGRTAANTLQRMVPGVQFSENDAGELQAIIDEKNQGESLLTALPKGFLDTTIEVVTERAGEGVNRGAAALWNRIPKGSKLDAMKMVVAKRWMEATGGTASAFRQRLAQVGYNGVLSEMGEERLGELLRAPYDGYRTPSGQQLLSELILFSIPGATATVAGAATDAANRRTGTVTPGRATDPEVAQAVEQTQAQRAAQTASNQPNVIPTQRGEFPTAVEAERARQADAAAQPQSSLSPPPAPQAEQAAARVQAPQSTPPVAPTAPPVVSPDLTNPARLSAPPPAASVEAGRGLPNTAPTAQEIPDVNATGQADPLRAAVPPAQPARPPQSVPVVPEPGVQQAPAPAGQREAVARKTPSDAWNQVHDDLMTKGFRFIDSSAPDAISFGNTRNPTFQLGDVKIGISTSGVGIDKHNRVFTYQSFDPNSLHLESIYTEPKSRGKGLASKVLSDVVQIADTKGITLTMEPGRIKGMTPGLTDNQLKTWYSKLGFKPEGREDSALWKRTPSTTLKATAVAPPQATAAPVNQELSPSAPADAKVSAEGIAPVGPSPSGQGAISGTKPPVAPAWRLTDKQFKEGGRWTEYPETVELPSVYRQIAKNEGPAARDAVYELNNRGVKTLDTHATDTEIVIHVPPSMKSAAEQFAAERGGRVRSEKLGEYIYLPKTAPAAVPDTSPTPPSTTTAPARTPAGPPVSGESAATTSPSGQSQQSSDVPGAGPSAQSISLREARGSGHARTAAREFVNKPLQHKSGIVATVSGETLSKMLSRSAVDRSVSPQAHMQAVANLDRLFPVSELRQSRPAREGERTIKQMHHFDVPMTYEGEPLNVKILAKEFVRPEQGTRLYTVEAVEIENKKPHVNRGEPTSPHLTTSPVSVPPVGLRETSIGPTATEVKENPPASAKTTEPKTSDYQVRKIGSEWQTVLPAKKGAPTVESRWKSQDEAQARAEKLNREGGEESGGRGSSGFPDESATPTPSQWQPSTMAGKAKAQISAPDIVKGMQNLVDVPIRFGHGDFGKRKALGWFNRRNYLIRQREANSVTPQSRRVLNGVGVKSKARALPHALDRFHHH